MDAPPLDLSDILENLSNLHNLEEFTIAFPIFIKPEFMAKRASSPKPFQLTSLKRLVLKETKPNGALQQNYLPFDGLAWCRTIHAVFPNLEELSIRTLTQDRLNAIQAHVHLWCLRKCSLDYDVVFSDEGLYKESD